MLQEILLFATATTAPDLRRLGLVGDAVALWSRATRCRAAWAPHEARCHRVIERACAGLDRHRTALVLGSGLLRDVSVPALLVRFRRVILVDAVHLWPARRASRDPRITRVVTDLTGVASAVTAGTRDAGDPLAAFRADPEIDFVLSANVLSQMPMAIERWCERRPRAAARVPSATPHALIARHLDGLAAFQARTCLLTDIRHREVARDGRVIEETDLLHGLSLPPPDEAWDWEVAPLGEIGRRASHIHRVHAYGDYRGRPGHERT